MKIYIIGGGFSGLAAATILASEGHQVTILEKNNTLGGRSRRIQEKGFTFDMGPSWYWMPDVFERYFHLFGKKTSDYYQLKRLDPSYSVFFSKDTYLQVPADKKKLVSMFESIETGAGERLIRFLQEAERKYTIAMKDFIYTPSLSFLEFFRLDILKQFFTLDIFSSMKNHIHKHFSHPHLRTLMEFPILFLGATSTNTPALYSIMNYADMELGTWYPEKGMYSVVEAMELLAREKGVTILTNTEVQKIIVQNRKAYALLTPKENFYPDVVISSADYQHTDNHLLDYPYQNYSHSYWEKKIFAPSALLFYVGINKKLTSITHHTLFFDASLEEHSQSIYTHKQYPQNPLFYLSATSQTDETTAPHGCENLVFLIPLAVDLEDTEEMREKYFQIIVKRFETLTGESIQHNIIYKKSYSLQNFKQDYHAFKGNAYGLANTLWQTALWKPKIINKHISNLYYTGQLTVPGPGVPPCLISGEIVAKYILKKHKKQ